MGVAVSETAVMTEELETLAQSLGQQLQAAGLMLATAESCTGGWIAKVVTDIPGSSGWLDRGFVTYSNAAKREMLGVAAATLESQGAVSEAVVREMALGALARSRAGVAVAVSGIAGPGGGSAEKPLGTVCFAWALSGRELVTRRECFGGDREAVRRQTVQRALEGLIDLLEHD
jgi:nicotinamide-nucleotide amidase